MVDTSLDDLDPELHALVPAWLAKCERAGLDVKITETFRDPAREDQLHAEHITPATSKTCDHCHMLDGKPASRAFDFACFKNHVYIKDGKHPDYTLAGQIAEDLGLKWGGNFSKPDADHIELS